MLETVKKVVESNKVDSLWVSQLFNLQPSDELRILCLDRVFGNIQPYELFALLTIAKARNARHIFEIGTYNGRTTRNFAANLNEGRVFTLDLPPNVDTSSLSYALDQLEVSLVKKNEVGTRYRGTPEENKIEQLYGDSASFDFTPYFQKMDLVFVDGSHALDYVRSDSINALKLVNSSGIVVWHDYGDEFPDVRAFIQQQAETDPTRRYVHLLHTLMVVAIPLQSE